MIHPAMDSAVSAENAPRFQQPLGKPSGFPTDSTATTTTRYSWCPPKRGRSTVALMCGQNSYRARRGRARTYRSGHKSHDAQRPAASAGDLHRKADDHKAGRREPVEVGEVFERGDLRSEERLV